MLVVRTELNQADHNYIKKTFTFIKNNSNNNNGFSYIY
ncbi:hypothetical protein PCIT_a4266 [Pseudoalteromonas citrea]|uniref:Uncharacterized protein n=1 Tax=Pseudoalteromonas citrea TaxID=43655 RepID=A0AAD4AIG8_9GAMM|nr:hypothetical protein PCIT_a4266 [Pseudoalteromonas citrea]